jgi:DNA-binding transcriptional ArsR family regulator
VLELVAGCFRALGDPTRLGLLRALKAGDKTVQELVAGTGWTQPNVSRHLSILARAGLVARTKRGAWVHYRVADPRIFFLCEGVCGHVDRMLAGYRPSEGAAGAAKVSRRSRGATRKGARA